MKTTNQIMRVLSVLFVSILITSCSPEDGKDGIDGIDGIDGTNGQQGPIGNANVIVSTWKNSTISKDTIIDGTSMRVATVAASELTDEIIQKSAILVYIDYGGGIFPLPFTSRAGSRMSTISFFPRKGKIRPTRIVYDGGAILNLGSNIFYKYVIIPQASNTQRLMSNENRQEKFILNEELYTLEELKAMSYEEMCILLNILE